MALKFGSLHVSLFDMLGSLLSCEAVITVIDIQDDSLLLGKLDVTLSHPDLRAVDTTGQARCWDLGDIRVRNGVLDSDQICVFANAHGKERKMNQLTLPWVFGYGALSIGCSLNLSLMF